MATTLPGHRAPAVCPPGADDLDDGRDDQQAADRSGGAGQVAEERGPPPVAPPDGDEEGDGQQDEQRLGVAHDEDKRRRGQHDQPDRPPGDDRVLVLGAGQHVDPDPQRGGAATFVISSEAMPTVSVVMSLSPRSSSGSKGKKRVADRGSGP